MLEDIRKRLIAIGLQPLKIIPYKAGHGFSVQSVFDRKLTVTIGYIEDIPGVGRIWVPPDVTIELEDGFVVDLLSTLPSLLPDVREYQALRRRADAARTKPQPTPIRQLRFGGLDEVA